MNVSAAFPTLPVPPRQGKVDPPSLPPLADLSQIDANDQETIKHVSAPVQRIQIEEDVPVWLQSIGHHQYLLFLARVAQACIGKETVCPPAKEAETLSEGVQAVLGLLTTLDSWKEEVRPLDTPQRFGNLAFRTWGQRLDDVRNGYVSSARPQRS
jgi:serine/threonine-protein phosphatase 2A activator